MKKVICVVLMILMISLTVSTSVGASIVPQQKDSYCDICDEVRYYWYLPSYGYEPQIPCTEEDSVILDCGHKKVLRAIKPHHAVAQLNITEGIARFVCLNCGIDLFTEPLTDEIYNKCEHLIYENKYRPTCENDGFENRIMCMCCGFIKEEGTTIPALGHNLVSNKDGKEATCTESGYTDSYKCKRYDRLYGYCDYVVEREVIPALGHDMGSHDTPATCGEEGRKGGNYCGRKGCNYVVKAPTIIPATGIHTEEVIKGVVPNCYRGGESDGVRCSDCRKVLVEKEPLPPTHTEITIRGVEPTCTETGITDGKYCTTCRTVLVARTEIEQNPDNHTAKTVDKKSATYFEKGYSGDKICKDCDEVISKGKSTPVLKLKTPTAKYTAGKKTIKVKYTKVKDATGFQVRCKLGKKTITKTYTTKKSVTKTIKNLKKGTYKVQVRSFVKQGSKKAYSNWSKAVKVKIK